MFFRPFQPVKNHETIVTHSKVKRANFGYPGRVSAEVANQLTEKEYEKYRIIQDKAFESDFDRIAKKYLKAGEKSGQKKKN